MDDAEGSIVERDAAAVDEEGVALSDESPKVKDDDSIRYSLSWWLSFAIPISIGLVAIMGALVGYGVEDHAALASAYDTDAQVSATYLSGHDYDALLTTEAAATDHALWEELTGAGKAGNGVAVITAAAPACLSFGTGATSVATAQATVNCRLAEVFSGFALPGYWGHGNPGVFNSQRFTSDWIALGNLGRDVAVSRHSAAADDQRNQERRLLWLGILLALALAFCTLAQAATHHRWSKRPVRVSLLLTIPGWILLVGCSAAFLVWEF